jgi:hypothetical protein
MGKIKDTLIALGGLGMILSVGIVLILVFGALTIGIKMLWAMIPFGIAGFILGSVILFITGFLARQFMPERKIRFSGDFFNELGFLEISGYLFGLIIIFASLLWFVLPDQVLRGMPSFGNVLAYSLVAILLFYGAAECLAVGIITLRTYFLGSVFYIGCGLLGIYLVNMPIWKYTESLPGDYFLLGKVLFVFLFLLQIFYMTFFHFIPALLKNKKEVAERNQKLK